MKPGSTALPVPSIRSASAGGSTWRPTAVIRPPETTIVPVNGSLPDPSTMRAPTMAIGGRGCACGRAVQSAPAVTAATATPSPRATRVSGRRSVMTGIVRSRGANHPSDGLSSAAEPPAGGHASPHDASRASR